MLLREPNISSLKTLQKTQPNVGVWWKDCACCTPRAVQ